MRAGQVCELLETDPHNHAEEKEAKTKYFMVSSFLFSVSDQMNKFQ